MVQESTSKKPRKEPRNLHFLKKHGIVLGLMLHITPRWSGEE